MEKGKPMTINGKYYPDVMWVRITVLLSSPDLDEDLKRSITDCYFAKNIGLVKEESQTFSLFD